MGSEAHFHRISIEAISYHSISGGNAFPGSVFPRIGMQRHAMMFCMKRSLSVLFASEGHSGSTLRSADHSPRSAQTFTRAPALLQRGTGSDTIVRLVLGLSTMISVWHHRHWDLPVWLAPISVRTRTPSITWTINMIPLPQRSWIDRPVFVKRVNSDFQLLHAVR